MTKQNSGERDTEFSNRILERIKVMFTWSRKALTFKEQLMSDSKRVKKKRGAADKNRNGNLF